MPIFPSDISHLVLAGMKTEFDLAYRRATEEDIMPQIASVIPTTLPTQGYPWLSATPVTREFKSERQLKAMKENYQAISDRTWEATIGINRKAFEDDQYGIINARTNDLGRELPRHKHQLVVQSYAAGATGTGPDGTTLISTAHAESGTNQSNMGTAALADTTLKAAMSAMMQYTDDLGVPMGITPDTLVVGPANLFTARTLLQSTINIATALGSTSAASVQGNLNALQGMLKLVVSPYLTGTYANYWFVLDTSRAVRGILYQYRSDVPDEFAYMRNPETSEDLFMRDLIKAGARGRYNTGFGLWQTAYGGIV